MHDIAIYDANTVINWLKVPPGESSPRPLHDFYEYGVLQSGAVRLLMTRRWFDDARGGFAATRAKNFSEVSHFSRRDFDILIQRLKDKFGIPSQPIEQRIANERIAFSIPEDPNDNHLAEAAIASQARYLVTRDHHVLALRCHSVFLDHAPNTFIVTPRQFQQIRSLSYQEQQKKFYLNHCLRYLHARDGDRGMWITQRGRQVRLTPLATLMRCSMWHLHRTVSQHWKTGLTTEQDQGSPLRIQYRKKGGGGPDGSGTPPSDSGPSTPPTQTPPRQGKRPMLSIQPVAAGGDYHGYLKSEYYLDEARVGQWCGSGAKSLGLTGDVDERTFARLLDGYGPDGKGLVQNAGVRAGSNQREPGWDLTFSAPKDVSVLWAIADLKTRERIGRCHEKAVTQALDYLEAEAAWSRQKVSGSPKPVPVEAKLTIATFGHGASRERDPQLHTHCVVFNVGVRRDGTTGALLSRPNHLYRHKMAAGALYRATLAAELTREVGLSITPEKHGFSITGVPKELSKEFSKRRGQIEKELSKQGTQTAEASAAAAKRTRRSKSATQSTDLFRIWRETAASFGVTRESVAELIGHTKPSKEREKVLRRAVEQASAGAFERESFLSAKTLVRHTAHALKEGQANAREIRDAVSSWLARPDVRAIGKRGGETQYTTKAILEQEKGLLTDAKRLAAQAAHPVKKRALSEALKGFPDQKVSADDAKRNRGQREAVERLTKPEGLSILSGVAGTGKSTVLGSCREVWEKSGYTVIGAALSGVAAKNLEKSSGIKSDTLAMRLKQFEGMGIAATAWHHVKQVAKTAINQLHADVHLPVYKPYKLPSKAVVVLDEAGMVPTRDMARLTRAVTEAGAKLVIVGDKQQIQPILAGGPFASLEARMEAARLTHVTRQKLDLDDKRPAWKRDVATLMESGKVGQGLSMFAERGLFHVAPNQEGAKQSLVDAWTKAGGAKAPKEHLIIANTNRDVRELNERAQAARLEGTEGKRPLHGAEINGKTIFEGDRVLFTKKSRKLGVDNGELGTVEKISGFGRRTKLVVTLDDERSLTVPIAKYNEVTLGYAVTTHKAQGVTVENAFVLMGGRMQDRHITYVQATRAAETTRFYASRYEAGPELSRIAESVSQGHHKEMAHDVSQPAPTRRQDVGRQQETGQRHAR